MSEQWPFSEKAGGELLDSWKEIAAYLKRDVRTVQRWEQMNGLPVHRLPGAGKPGVYAVQSELDDWMRGRPADSVELAGSSSAADSVAVLPFMNLAGEKDDEYFADGLADEIITGLTRIPGLRVIARTSSFAFRGQERDIREIGKRLRASVVLEGSLRRAGELIRVTAQLIDASNGYHIWGDCFERPLSDMFGVQDEITSCVVDSLRGQLRSAPAIPVRNRPDPEAYRRWLKGRALSRRQNPHDLVEGRICCAEAVALDPHFAEAHLAVAESWWECAVYGLESPREAVAVGRANVVRAIELNPELAEALAMLAVYQGVQDFNWELADQTFTKAMDMNPASTKVRILRTLYLLEPLARLQEAEQEIRSVLERDPLSPEAQTYLGQCLMLQRRFPEALQQLWLARQLSPDYWLSAFVLGGTLAMTGQIEQVVALAPPVLEAVGPNPILLGAMGAIIAMSGRTEKAQAILSQLQDLATVRYVSPLAFAWLHHGLGNFEDSFNWLVRAVRAREPQIVHLPTKALYDSLRADPRFNELLAEMRLLPGAQADRANVQ